MAGPERYPLALRLLLALGAFPWIVKQLTARRCLSRLQLFDCVATCPGHYDPMGGDYEIIVSHFRGDPLKAQDRFWVNEYRTFAERAFESQHWQTFGRLIRAKPIWFIRIAIVLSIRG